MVYVFYFTLLMAAIVVVWAIRVSAARDQVKYWPDNLLDDPEHRENINVLGLSKALKQFRFNIMLSVSFTPVAILLFLICSWLLVYSNWLDEFGVITLLVIGTWLVGWQSGRAREARHVATSYKKAHPLLSARISNQLKEASNV